MSQSYDIAIVGGGLVGASLCKALAHLPLRIAVIESKSITLPHSHDSDARSIALSYGSSRIFSGIDIWQELLPHCSPILNIHVSDQGHFGSSLFSATQAQVPALGYVISFSKMTYILQQHLSHCANVELLAPAQVTDIAYTDNKNWKITLKHHDQENHINTQLLIAADGHNSFIRQHQNISVQEQNYLQTAILTKVSLKHAHHNIAYERFTKDGSIALLPLEGLNASLVWATPHATAHNLMSLSDELFLEKLQYAFGYRLGHFQNISARHLFPLKMTQAKQLTKPGLLLLGNAAQSLHPIAAQGFNLSLKHVAILAELIDKCHQNGLCMNDVSLLQSYVQRIEKDRQQTIKFTHYLTQLFGNNIFPLDALRDCGLLLLDILPTPKKLFARKCMGITGHLPKLLRGVPLY